MSGFISSFLIDSIFRQARGVSSQPTIPEPSSIPPDHRHESSSSSPPADILSSSNHNNTHNRPLRIDTRPSLNSRSRRIANRQPLPLGFISDFEGQIAASPTYNDEVSAKPMNNSENPLASDDENLQRVGSSVVAETSQGGSVHADGDSNMASDPVEFQRDDRLERNMHPLRQLPEDDGMTILRRKIHDIRDKDATVPEKAQLIHFLMTESYNSAKNIFVDRPSPVSRSPSSERSLERLSISTSPKLRRSFDQLSLEPVSPSRTAHFHDLYNLSPSDLEPTFVPKEPAEVSGTQDQTPEANLPVDDGDDDNESSEVEEALGCQHYKRNVKLQCHTCKKWYTCRFCHDEAEDHSLERHKTENMLCMLCTLPQPAAQRCKGCGGFAASYFCGVCKLWDNDSSKSIYHCDDCGICRIGQGLGKDFFHCKTCSVCMPISIENTHRCIERSTQCDCPICGDYMFTSPDTVVFMRCGHSIHHKCYAEYSKTSYRCPICSKSITNMESRFRNLDRTIESQPMPTEFRDTKALVYCNDCGAKSAVKYHWLGLKCDLCESYNTAQIRLLGDIDREISDNSSLHTPRTASFRSNDISCETEASETDGEGFPRSNVFLRPATSASLDQLSEQSLPQPRPREVSPTVSNYFELSRDSTWSPSIFSRRRSEGEGDTGLHRFWATSPLRRYSLFLMHGDSTDEESDADDDGQDESDVDLEEDEDEDDEIDPIEIFGHR